MGPPPCLTPDLSPPGGPWQTHVGAIYRGCQLSVSFLARPPGGRGLEQRPTPAGSEGPDGRTSKDDSAQVGRLRSIPRGEGPRCFGESGFVLHPGGVWHRGDARVARPLMCDAACIMGTPRIGIPRVPKSWGPMAVVRWPLLQGHISVKFPWMNQSFCNLFGLECQPISTSASPASYNPPSSEERIKHDQRPPAGEASGTQVCTARDGARDEIQD